MQGAVSGVLTGTASAVNVPCVRGDTLGPVGLLGRSVEFGAHCTGVGRAIHVNRL